MFSFADIQFDHEEENIPDHMLMSGKQFKILNQKLNFLRYIKANTRSRNTVSGIEVDVLLRSQEHRLKVVIEQIESKYEERVKHHVENFQSEFKQLREVAEEQHILFFEEVKKVQEYINLKVESLKSELLKEVTKVEQCHLSLQTKLNVFSEEIRKLVENFTAFSIKDPQVFTKTEDFLARLKESILKLYSSPESPPSQESLSQMFSSLE
ncbi:unnamed protein product [Lactuca saligna]|uniref:Uncharacterized protein n=1 Tax=Lactuca saligna TaxID=75948 RepID=A0AA35ZUB6_LACSI|nr:unnamed protein product [Lactuca saligna]